MPPSTPGQPGARVLTRVTRRIDADPTSTALLLAGPTALELWPGLRRVAEVSGRIVVETELATRSTAASVRALPPRRTPTSYVTRFGWTGPGLPDTDAELTLGYLPTGDGDVVTHAALVLDSEDLTGTAVDAGVLESLASGFLTNLAHAAELRNRAA